MRTLQRSFFQVGHGEGVSNQTIERHTVLRVELRHLNERRIRDGDDLMHVLHRRDRHRDVRLRFVAQPIAIGRVLDGTNLVFDRLL